MHKSTKPTSHKALLASINDSYCLRSKEFLDDKSLELNLEPFPNKVSTERTFAFIIDFLEACLGRVAG